MKELNECFKLALRDELKGKKHKGLLITKLDNNKAKEYLDKAKTNLLLCDLYKEKGFDYKIPEEWFYTLYYCALAILSKFGVESREIEGKYDYMNTICKKAISQSEEIVFSNNEFKLPKEILNFISK